MKISGMTKSLLRNLQVGHLERQFSKKCYNKLIFSSLTAWSSEIFGGRTKQMFSTKSNGSKKEEE
jgi:hypothetical protein